MTSLLPAIAVFQESLSAGRTLPPFRFGMLGKSAWGLSFCALMVAVFAAMAVKRIRSGEPDQRALARSALDMELIWGVGAAALGAFFTAMSLILLATNVLRADRVDLFLILAASRLSLGASALGLFIFVVSGLLWLGLRRWHRKAVLGDT